MKVLLGIIAVPLVTILQGFALKQLWAWFVVPQFHLTPLSIPVALGIALTAHYLTTNASAKHETYGFAEQLGIGTAGAAIVLLFGFIYHAFM